MKAIIQLTGMEFFAYHGLYPGEEKNGGHYKVDVKFSAEVTDAALHDEISGTVDYAMVYILIRDEMQIPSKLLEHLASRIVKKIEREFPMATDLEVTVRKLEPPMGGVMENVSVTIKQ